MTPSPVERKFAYIVEDLETSPEYRWKLWIRGYDCVVKAWKKSDRPWAHREANFINLAHESAIAEAVKAAVERCASIARNYGGRGHIGQAISEIILDQGATHG